jgi:hypothetical protein
MRIRQRVEEALRLERDGRGEFEVLSHSRRPRTERFRAWARRGKSGEREAGASPQRSVRSDWRLAENQTRRWVRLFTEHATVPSASEMRDEAIGALRVAQRKMQLYPVPLSVHTRDSVRVTESESECESDLD